MLPQRSWNLKILWCFGLERIFKDHLVQLPWKHLQLNQVAQTPIQPNLDCFQGWDIHNSSDQAIPLFHHVIVKSFFHASSLNLSSFSLKSWSLVIYQQALVKDLSPPFLQSPCGVQKTGVLQYISLVLFSVI